MGIVIDPAVIAARRAGLAQPGLWLERTVEDFLARHVDERPDRTALVGVRGDAPARRFSYAQLGAMVDRAAGALRAMGIGHGDVVSLQLPNGWEFVVAALACVRVGAVCNPIVHILRERELRWIVEFAGSKLLIVPSTFRRFDFASMARTIQAGASAPLRVIVAGEAGPDGFEAALLGSDAPPLSYDPAAPALAPDDLLVLIFTSGTTGEPKGVMHTSNTVLGHLLRTAEALGLGDDEVFFGATPLGHMTGYGHFVMMPMLLGATVVLQDYHEPHAGLRIMEEEGVSFSAGATPFLADLVECARTDGIRPRRLRRFWCGGAPIPPALVDRVLGELALPVCSLWGMTEVTAATMTSPQAPERAATSDGRALPGIEVKVVDDAGAELPRGQVGRLMVRGASLFCGYLKRPEYYRVDGAGWFDSGDLARMDAEGFIRIAGRTKELVIRGGENIPVIEVENLLLRHPAVAEVAIVGMPDERLGERACAFVVTRAGLALDLPATQAYLAEARLAKPFWPERIECVDELPKTPSGKVQRFVLKERAARFGA